MTTLPTTATPPTSVLNANDSAADGQTCGGLRDATSSCASACSFTTPTSSSSSSLIPSSKVAGGKTTPRAQSRGVTRRHCKGKRGDKWGYRDQPSPAIRVPPAPSVSVSALRRNGGDGRWCSGVTLAPPPPTSHRTSRLLMNTHWRRGVPRFLPFLSSTLASDPKPLRHPREADGHDSQGNSRQETEELVLDSLVLRYRAEVEAMERWRATGRRREAPASLTQQQQQQQVQVQGNGLSSPHAPEHKMETASSSEGGVPRASGWRGSLRWRRLGERYVKPLLRFFARQLAPSEARWHDGHNAVEERQSGGHDKRGAGALAHCREEEECVHVLLESSSLRGTSQCGVFDAAAEEERAEIYRRFGEENTTAFGARAMNSGGSVVVEVGDHQDETCGEDIGGGGAVTGSGINRNYNEQYGRKLEPPELASIFLERVFSQSIGRRLRAARRSAQARRVTRGMTRLAHRIKRHVRLIPLSAWERPLGWSVSRSQPEEDVALASAQERETHGDVQPDQSEEEEVVVREAASSSANSTRATAEHAVQTEYQHHHHHHRSHYYNFKGNDQDSQDKNGGMQKSCGDTSAAADRLMHSVLHVSRCLEDNEKARRRYLRLGRGPAGYEQEDDSNEEDEEQEGSGPGSASSCFSSVPSSSPTRSGTSFYASAYDSEGNTGFFTSTCDDARGHPGDWHRSSILSPHVAHTQLPFLRYNESSATTAAATTRARRAFRAEHASFMDAAMNERMQHTANHSLLTAVTHTPHDAAVRAVYQRLLENCCAKVAEAVVRKAVARTHAAAERCISEWLLRRALRTCRRKCIIGSAVATSSNGVNAVNTIIRPSKGKTLQEQKKGRAPRFTGVLKHIQSSTPASLDGLVLDDADTDVITRIHAIRGSDEVAVSLQSAGYSITYAQLSTLRPRTWLNDQVINNYLQLLCEECGGGDKMSGEGSTVVSLGTHFYAKVQSEIQGGGGVDAAATAFPPLAKNSALPRWLRRRSHILLPCKPEESGVSAKETSTAAKTTTTTTVRTVLVPVNLFDQHWALAVLHKDFRSEATGAATSYKDTWYMYDSLCGSERGRVRAYAVLRRLAHAFSECKRILIDEATTAPATPSPAPSLLVAHSYDPSPQSSLDDIATAPYPTLASLAAAQLQYKRCHSPATDAAGSSGNYAERKKRSSSDTDVLDEAGGSEWFCGGVDHMPQQHNGDDCGVFVCQAAWCAAQGVAVNFCQEEVFLLRSVITLELWSKRLLRRLPGFYSSSSAAVSVFAVEEGGA